MISLNTGFDLWDPGAPSGKQCKRIPPLQDCLDGIVDRMEYYKHIAEEADKEARKLQEENWKDEELQKMKEEVERIKRERERGFSITDDEWERIETWTKEHESTWKHEITAIGGRYDYIFTPTSLGNFLTVRCSCGAEFNATDYNKM